MKTMQEYETMVAKMVENHGVIAPGACIPWRRYIATAYEMGMTPARCASNVSGRIIDGRKP